MPQSRPFTIMLAAIGLSAQLALAENFTVIALPDTQQYALDYPEIYLAQTQWIADNIQNLNVQFVTHHGDVVGIGTAPEHVLQWENARAALDILDATNIPVGVCIGNHDIWGTDGDINGDGNVDSTDLAILLAAFGSSCS